jgi:hypothetical protein
VGLYVVRCYGRLDVPEWIASHIVAGTWHGEVINEVLLEASLEESQRIERMKNVLSVELAEPGVFPDDADGAVIVREDGGWEAVEDEAEAFPS